MQRPGTPTQGNMHFHDHTQVMVEATFAFEGDECSLSALASPFIFERTVYEHFVNNLVKEVRLEGPVRSLQSSNLNDCPRCQETDPEALYNLDGGSSIKTLHTRNNPTSTLEVEENIDKDDEDSESRKTLAPSPLVTSPLNSEDEKDIIQSPCLDQG